MISIEVQYQWLLQHITSQDHHSTHTRLGEKHKTILVVSQLDILSHTSMHTQCQTHDSCTPPTSQQKRESYCCDWLFIHSASLWIQYLLHGSLCMYWPSDLLTNAHRDSKHCKYMASLYKHMGELQRTITWILRHESKFLMSNLVFRPILHAHVKIRSQVLPIPPWIRYLLFACVDISQIAPRSTHIILF